MRLLTYFGKIVIMDKDTTATTGDETFAVPLEGETPTTTEDTIDATNTGSGETQEPELTADEIKRELARLRLGLKRANAEAKRERESNTSLKEKASELDRLKAEKLSKEEKLANDLAESQKANEQRLIEVQELKLKNAINIHATKLNFHDPEDATRYLDHSLIDYDTNGSPTNIPDLLKTVSALRPYLMIPSISNKNPPVNVGNTNPPRTVTNDASQKITWEYIGNLKPIDYDKLTVEKRKEIQIFMADPRNIKR